MFLRSVGILWQKQNDCSCEFLAIVVPKVDFAYNFTKIKTSKAEK